MTEPGANVEAAARLALASIAFAEPADWWAPALTDWVAAFDPLADAGHFEVTADVRLDHLRWRIVGPADVIGPRAAAWFDQLGLGTGPVPLAPAAAVAKGAAACWIDVSADDLRSGWEVEGPPGIPAASLWPALPDTPPLRTLAQWCHDEQVPTVLRAGVMAGGAGDTDVLLALPGSTFDAQLGAGLDLFARLRIAPPPDEALGPLSALGRPRLCAQASLTPAGVAALSIGSVEPTTELLLHLSDVWGGGDDRSLAAFEAALGVTDRALVEVVRATRPAVRVTYRLA